MDRGQNTVYKWVPAHEGIVGKEEADDNAKQSLQDSSVNININLNYNEIKSITTSFLNNSWQSNWNNNQHSHHHHIQPLISKPGPTYNIKQTNNMFNSFKGWGL